MLKLTDSAGGATLTTGETSQIVGLSDIDYVQFTFVGDASTGTLTLQQQIEANGSWVTFAPSGVPQTFTNTTLSGATATHTVTYVVGGCNLRLSLATAGTLSIYVTGRYVTPKAI